MAASFRFIKHLTLILRPKLSVNQIIIPEKGILTGYPFLLILGERNFATAPCETGELLFLGSGFLVSFEEGLLDVGGNELTRFT